MSTAIVIQLFEAIEKQYEADGTVDPNKKEMLLDEMEKYMKSEIYVRMIKHLFDELEYGDDSDDVEIVCSIESVLSNEVCNTIEEPSDLQNDSRPTGTDTVTKAARSRRNKRVKFNILLNVFSMFKFSCAFEQTLEPEEAEEATEATTTHNDNVKGM